MTNAKEFFINLWTYIKNNFVKLFTLATLIGVAIAIFVIFTAGTAKISQIDYDNICKDRLSKCMNAFSLYPKMNIMPIPEFYENKNYNMPQYPHALCDYFYACSYKSYLPCGYTGDIVSYDAIRNVLLKGARVINLDIYFDGKYAFDPDAKIIVANTIKKTIMDTTQQPSQNVDVTELQVLYPDKNNESNCKKENYLMQYLEFINCLDIIKDLGWIGTNAPLFLYINMDFLPNKRLEYQIYTQIMNKLSNYLIDKYYGFQRVNIGAMPFSRAKNKLIILTNRKPVNSFFDEITNGIIAPLGNIPLYEISGYDAITYGASVQIGSDVKRTIENTSRNLVAVIKKPVPDDNNEITPKIDTFNYDTTYNFNVGICFSFMYWQNYPDEQPSKTVISEQSPKKFMQEYYNRFINGGMILKPENLRYIPKPKEDEYIANKSVEFTNIQVSGMNGFMEFQI